MAQTCSLERTRSLPNGNLHSGYVHFFMQACLNLTGRSGFKKQPKRFLKILSSFFDCVTLAGDIQLWAERHISIPFAFDNRCKLLFHHIYPNSPERTINAMAISTPLDYAPNP